MEGVVGKLGCVVMTLEMREFLKVVMSTFMHEGVRGFLCFRIDSDEFSCFMSDGGMSIAFLVKEDEACAGSDYYLFDGSGQEVVFTCHVGMPSLMDLKTKGIVFIVNPTSFLCPVNDINTSRDNINTGGVG